jgi:hypothetical protein
MDEYTQIPPQELTHLFQHTYRKRLYSDIQKLTRDLHYYIQHYFTEKTRHSISSQLKKIIDKMDTIKYRYKHYYKKRGNEYVEYSQQLNKMLPPVYELVDIFWNKPAWDLNHDELVYKKYKHDIEHSWVTENDLSICLHNHTYSIVFHDINNERSISHSEF